MRYNTSQLIELIRAAAASAGQDPDIAVAQLRRETSFIPAYVYGPQPSDAGAMGLGQFLPGTWARFGQGNPFNPDDAIPAYLRYMRFLLDMFGQDYRLALAGYHAGENDAYGVLRNPAGNPKSTAYWQEILQAAGRSDLINQPRPTRPPATKRKTPAASPSRKRR